MKKKKKILERDRWDITPEDQRRLMEKSVLPNFHYEEDEGPAEKAAPVYHPQPSGEKKKDHTTGFYVIHTFDELDRLYPTLKQGDIVMTMRPSVKMLLMLNPAEKSYKVFHDTQPVQPTALETPDYEIQYKINRLLNILTITDSVKSYSFDLNKADEIDLNVSSVTLAMLEQYMPKIMDFIKINLFPSMIVNLSDANSVFTSVLNSRKVTGKRIKATYTSKHLFIHIFSENFDSMFDEIRTSIPGNDNQSFLKVLLYIAQSIEKMGSFNRYTGFNEHICKDYQTEENQNRIKNLIGYNLSETISNTTDILSLLNATNASQIYLSGESLVSGLCASEENDDDEFELNSTFSHAFADTKDDDDEESLFSKKLKEHAGIEEDDEDDEFVFDAFDEVNEPEPMKPSSNKDDSSESFVVPLVRKGR